ncbi:MAG: hypothetical protein CSA44_01670, partial [Gammaproteobacteria bacterium]
MLAFGYGHADMVKCIIQENPVVTNYFDSSDDKERAKCKSKPITVVTSSGQKIKNKYSNSGSAYKTKKSQVQFQPIAAKDVKPMGCSGSGGTVKVNGRIFHLDAAALCRKYGSKGKGSISHGIARHVKLNHVDADFRRKISPYVNKVARKYGMEPEFIHAIISAESAYKPNATSHVGAMG